MIGIYLFIDEMNLWHFFSIMDIVIGLGIGNLGSNPAQAVYISLGSNAIGKDINNLFSSSSYDWLVGFYGKSTIVGYIMPNSLYKYSGCLKIDATH